MFRPTALRSAVASIRYREAVIFRAPVVLGLAVFIPVIALPSVGRALIACMGSFLIAASILAFNDWADISLDSQNSLKRPATFVERGVRPVQMLGVALALAAGGIFVFSFLSARHIAASVTAIVLGLAYSVPVGGLRGKSVPLLSSILHFGGAFLSFLLGALTFAPPDPRGLLIATHPAILLTTGHLVQEVEDYEEDRLSNCRTNAVRFGQMPVFIVASLLLNCSVGVL